MNPPEANGTEPLLRARDRDGQRIYTIEANGEAVGTVVVDSVVAGRSRGGLRLLPDVSEEEIRLAARSMTLKFGFLGLPQGGSKAGVIGDPEADPESRRERLLAFARGALPLLRERRFVPDADLGTRTGDIRWMMEAVGVGAKRREWRGDRSGHYTAVSCAAAADAAVRHRGGSLSGCAVAIAGFGMVGSALADLLRRRGARIVAVSTSRGAIHRKEGLDVDRLLECAAREGSRFVTSYGEADSIPREALLELPVDLLAPCARHHALNEGNAARIAAPVVCPGANNPATPGAERLLAERGALVVPDFLSNAGGVLGGTLEFAAVPARRVAALIEDSIVPRIESLLRLADARGVAPRDLAEPLALARHAEVRAAHERPTLVGRVLSLGLEGYRRGYVPRALVGALTPRYVERLLATGPSAGLR